MTALVFTKHAEEKVKALKGSEDAPLVLELLKKLETDPESVDIRSATEWLGSPEPSVDIREALAGRWRVIFTELLRADRPALVVLSVQKTDPDDLPDFQDVFSSMQTEVSSTISVIDPNFYGEFVTEPVPAPEDEKKDEKKQDD